MSDQKEAEEDSREQEFLDRVYRVLASKDLLGNIRLYFECLGYLKQRANDEAFTNRELSLKLMDFIDDYLQLLLHQAKVDNTVFGSMIFDGFTNPRIETFQEVFRVRQDQLKAANERRMFIEFCGAAGFPVEPESVRSEAPPKPDGCVPSLVEKANGVTSC